MATPVKRAIRRLVRGPDGSVRVAYIDLGTLLPVLDLTGYQILDTGQTTPEPEQSDNSDDQEVGINPPSGGSSAGRGSQTRGENDGRNDKPISKNPAIDRYIKSVTQPQTPVEDENVGGVTVTPDKEIADAEWADVPEGSGTTPRATSVPSGYVKTAQGSVLPDLKENFDKSLKDWSSPKAVTPPGTTNVSNVERQLEQRNELENIKDAGLIGDISSQKTSVSNTPQGIANLATPSNPGMANRVKDDRVSNVAKAMEDTPAKTVGNWAGIGADLGGFQKPTELSNSFGLANVGNLASVQKAVNTPTSTPSNPGMASKTKDDFAGPSVGGVSIDPERLGSTWGSVNKGIAQQIQEAAYGVSPVSDMQMEKTIDGSTRVGIGTISPGMTTPNTGPVANTNPGMASKTKDDWAGPEGTARIGGSVFDNPANNPNNQSVAKGIIAEASKPAGTAPNTTASKFNGVDLGSMSPARAATLGLVERTAAQQAAIAKTIAGELGPKTLANLTSTDEATRALARTEFANMATTIENRAASQMFGSLENALTPSQYNSLMTSALPNGTVPMDNTMANYNKYGTVLNEALTDYYTGNLTPTDYSLSSYYATSMEKPPNWAAEMTNAHVVGQHNFGTLPEYAPGEAFGNFTRQAVEQGPRGWTPALGGANITPGSRAAGIAAERSTYDSSKNGTGGTNVTGGSPSSFGGSLGSGSSKSGGTPGMGGSAHGTGGLGSTGVSSGRSGSPSGVGGGSIGGSTGAGPGRGSSIGGPSVGGSVSGKNSDGSDNGWGGRSGSV